MADDNTIELPKRATINVHEDYELEWWARQFGLSKDAVRAAVKKVGVMADGVAKELQPH
jgi:hypothetical protein